MTLIEQLKAEHRKHINKLRALAKAQGFKSEEQKNREFLREQDRITKLTNGRL